MKFFVVMALVFGLCVGTASAYVLAIESPDTAATGETYIPWIMGDMPSSCWYFVSMDQSEEPFVMVVDILIRYDNPTGGMCLGPTEPWELFPEFVFTYPGLWTIRVVEHREHPGVPDYPDGVWIKEVVVTGPVLTEASSFGAVKALYR